MKRYYAIISLLVLFVIGSVASAGANPYAGGVIHVGTDVDAGTMDPRIMRDTTAYRVCNLLYDGLVELDEKLTTHPGLAEKWETPDPKTWIFYLRKGVTFHDGTPFTADDVVFTFKTTLDPALNSRQRVLIQPIQKMEVLDSHTVKFTLSVPYAPILSYLDMGIVSKKAVESGKDPNTTPIGTGPMRLKKWLRGSRIVLEANKNYWNGVPNLSSLELILVGDNTARAQAFEAGDLDYIQSPLSPQDVQRLGKDQKIGRYIGNGLGITYIGFNNTDPLLADARMRQALSMLVDQETIVNQIYEGVDTPATSILLPSSWAFSPDVKQPTFNPEKAKALLAKIGWKDSNGDGILDKDGKPLSLTISTHSEDPNRIQSVEFVTAIWREAGVDAEVNISDWPAYSASIRAKKYQIGLQGWLNIVDMDKLMYGQFSSDGNLNWTGYKNPEMNTLLAKGRESLQQKDRAAAYQQAASILARELPYLVISYQGYQMFHKKDITWIVPNARGMLRSLLWFNN